jgi:hypothetical protein
MVLNEHKFITTLTLSPIKIYYTYWYGIIVTFWWLVTAT